MKETIIQEPFYYEHTGKTYQFTDTHINGRLSSRVCDEVDHCDCCGKITRLKYCKATDSYHCQECQDGDLVYTSYK